MYSKITIYLLLLFMGGAISSMAQIRIINPGRVVERQIENRANRKIDQAIDKGLDKAEEGIEGSVKKKNKKETTSEPSKQSKTETASTPASETQLSTPDKPTLQAYNKFDFIRGDKIVAIEDFSQDAVGDFPARWNTNSSAELVTIAGTEGKWLQLGPSGVFYPEFVQSLPENFTLEFNLASSSEFSFYSNYLRLSFAQLANPSKEFTFWRDHDGDKVKGLEVGLHPMDAGSKQGMSFVHVFGKELGETVMKNEKSFPAFHVPEHNVVKISVWRQKTRLRLYVDDYKVWDLPRAFDATIPYNFLSFGTGGYHEESNKFFIANLRLAVGAPDTRSKLITEGKFSTHGILFDSNSATIKPESYGVLKDIAQVLTENATVKVKIIGHTDADGDDASNLTLSKNRAASVKTALSTTFGIDAGRLETDGKGETEPSQPNTNAEGKASNRRVEFVKL